MNAFKGLLMLIELTFKVVSSVCDMSDFYNLCVNRCRREVSIKALNTQRYADANRDFWDLSRQPPIKSTSRTLFDCVTRTALVCVAISKLALMFC